MNDTERIQKLTAALNRCLSDLMALSTMNAESVARLQHMNVKQTKELVATWISENRTIQAVKNTLAECAPPPMPKNKAAEKRCADIIKELGF